MGKYYIGRHTTNNLQDEYLGSGKWVRSIKDKSSLIKTIISFHDSFDELLVAELELLTEHVGQERCMNFNNKPVGFASGKLNPANRPEQKAKSKKRFTLNNPSKNPENRQNKIARMTGRAATGKRAKGYKMTAEERHIISESRKKVKYSDEGRKKLSDSRKAQIERGERTTPSFAGRSHTEESKSKVRQKAFDRPKMLCPHCGVEAKPHTFKRWHGDNCRSVRSDLVKEYIIAREDLEDRGVITAL
jgi:hypothetical protein